MDQSPKDLETPIRVKSPWFERGAETKVTSQPEHVLGKFLHCGFRPHHPNHPFSPPFRLRSD